MKAKQILLKKIKNFILHVVRNSTFQNEICERILVSNYGERQYARMLGDVAGDHVDRYKFASELLRENDRVLDIACGIGYGTALIATDKGSRVHGVDLSPFAIIHARRYFGIENATFDAGDLFTFQGESPYDWVISFETLEHVPNEDRAIRSLRQNLRAGGQLLISTPNQAVRPFDILDTPYHLRHYTPAELKELLEANGFKLVRMFTQLSRNETRVVEGDYGYCLIAHAEAV